MCLALLLVSILVCPYALGEGLCWPPLPLPCCGPVCVDYGFPLGNIQHHAALKISWSLLPGLLCPSSFLQCIPKGPSGSLLMGHGWLFSVSGSFQPHQLLALLLNFTFLYCLPRLQRNVLHRCQNPTLIPLSLWLLGKHSRHCSWWRNAKLQLL